MGIATGVGTLGAISEWKASHCTGCLHYALALSVQYLLTFVSIRFAPSLISMSPPTACASFRVTSEHKEDLS